MKLEEILKAAGGRPICINSSEFAGLSIDSRTIKKDELFVAIKGDKFDGHDFLHDALKLGGGALVSRLPRTGIPDRTLIHVADTLRALQDIARYLCAQKRIPVVGVTGTNGKTTTKELLASILGRGRRVLKTAGNFNNSIGLPLSIANMVGDEEVMVLEMGSNVEGDIRLLCEIARPGFAVVTNVGPAHLEGFGDIETVRKTDLEILDFADNVCVNADDLFLMKGLGGFGGRVTTYGIEGPADVRAEEIILGRRGSQFRIILRNGIRTDVALSLSGRFNIYNALAAASVASEMGAGPEEIRKGLESFTGVPMRLEIREFMGTLVISDVYNANPASMREAVSELLRLRAKRTIAVLGDMLELGRYSAEAHSELAAWLSASGIDVLIAVGKEMAAGSSEFTGVRYTVPDAAAAKSLLNEICREGDTVLLKGSRGMHMEKALPQAAEIAGKRCGHAL